MNIIMWVFFFRQIAFWYSNIACLHQAPRHLGGNSNVLRKESHFEIALKVHLPSSIQALTHPRLWLSKTQNDYKEMIHSPHWRWPILFPQTNPELYSAVSACCGWKQVLEFIANCADFIENTRTGNGAWGFCSFGQKLWRRARFWEKGCTNKERS